jgi:3-phosphoshikimate 1-carboxyvinyltransferase
VGACAEGETRLYNAHVARHKECDRIAAMAKALKAMGADCEELPDGLVVRRSDLHSARLDSQGDHRMVMTLALAGMVASGRTIITDIECVKKTFPNFVSQMIDIGCDMQRGGER